MSQGTIWEAQKQLDSAIRTVKQGEFIQIERLTGEKVVSVVALRYTGDEELFRKKIQAMLDDANEALTDRQWVRVMITS